MLSLFRYFLYYIEELRKNINDLLICYHVGISPLGGLVESFLTTLFYHKP